jgi:molybdopterin-guanine dinucleotide biosynthesis protein A
MQSRGLLTKESMENRFEIPAVIFAGGKSSRMGRDKALLPFGKFSSLVEYQFHRLSKLFSEVYISWKSSKVEKLQHVSIYDSPKYSHISAPTVGLLSAMEKLQSEYIFIISVDAPLFERDNIKQLIEKLDERPDIISPALNGRAEPLLSIYKRELISDIREMAERGEHKLQNLLQKRDTKYVNFSEERPFTNLNYFEEYERARL